MKLIPWETPFFAKHFPSVCVRSDLEACNEVEIIVAPWGTDKYPKYRRHFETILAYRCADESYAPVALTNSILPEKQIGSSYYWEDSPWLQEFNETKSLWDGEHPVLRHFVLFGGDLVVEILASKQPVITEVAGPTDLPGYRI